MPSHQRAWQLKQIAAGRCRICGKRRIFTSQECRRCLALTRVRQAKNYQRRKRALARWQSDYDIPNIALDTLSKRA